MAEKMSTSKAAVFLTEWGGFCFPADDPAGAVFVFMLLMLPIRKPKASEKNRRPEPESEAAGQKGGAAGGWDIPEGA